MVVRKTTQAYATHGIPLNCDIYTQDDAPSDSPVFLYFHPGGLVDGNRDLIAPWLVQVCIQRKWPLISPSYRLLPQARGKGLLEDASATYGFAQTWDTQAGSKRKVIVGGASGGFFMAAIIAHSCHPKPLALFSIQGINTFRHRFFNSSVLIPDEEVSHASMQKHIAGPTQVGDMEPDESTFVLDKLTPEGAKNPDFTLPEKPEGAPSDESYRGMLYDYYTFNNSFVDLVGDVDPGYQWAKLPDAKDRVAEWPKTVIFHGNNDPDVELNVSEDMRDCLGEDKVTLIIADGQHHLYELEKFIEDDAPGMDAVKQAVAKLDEIVASLT
ncbi:alpha/beta-hydrolase [Trichoderma novae-zelandiae]